MNEEQFLDYQIDFPTEKEQAKANECTVIFEIVKV